MSASLARAAISGSSRPGGARGEFRRRSSAARRRAAPDGAEGTPPWSDPFSRAESAPIAPQERSWGGVSAAGRVGTSASVEEIRVASWNELLEALYAGSWQDPLGRYRSNEAFRGMADAADDLTTTLVRLGGPYAELETPLVRNFRRYARRDDVPDDSLWNWLALAQHHGLPTRLLDWTHSPFVALHFATYRLDRNERDAAVVCVDYLAANEYLPDRLRTLLEDEGSNLFTVEMLGRAAETLRDFDALAERPFAVFCEPPSFDERIVNQYALFSLVSSATVALDEWLEERPGLARKIVVPAELKLEVRDKLDQANVTERVLFPGLDGLSRWLTRYYTPAEGLVRRAANR